MNKADVKHIVIFTDSFPGGSESEAVFVMPEIAEALKRGLKVTVVPTAPARNAVKELPEGVTVDRFWCDSLAARSRAVRAMSLVNPSVWFDARGDLSRSGLTFCATSRLGASAIEKWIKSKGIDLNTTLFYTFWFDLMAGAMALLCARMPGVQWVSGAHGFDIFTRRGGRLRRLMLERVGAVYAASRSGAEFISGRYPEYAGKVKNRVLGCIDNGLCRFHTADEHKVTFLSVANVVKLKRVDLVARLVKAFAVAREGTEVKWIHVGDGPEMASLKAWIENERVPHNFTYELKGALTNSELMELYASEPIDWTMLLSTYEGGNPIAVCESLSHGVPVVATDTTGLAEAVDDNCALLLPLEMTDEEFVRGILPYVESDTRMASLRKNARERWEGCFNATNLRARFFDEILNNY